MFTLQTSSKPLLQGGGGVKLLLGGVTVNCKEENSLDFYPNCVQEFGLSTSNSGIVRSVWRNKYKKPGKYKQKTFLPKYAAYTYS